MKKQIKKVVGIMVLIAVLFTSAGQQAQAAQIKWPYGTYVATGKQVKKVFGAKKLYLDWQFCDNNYPELVRIWANYSSFENAEMFLFRKIGTNKYRTKKLDMTNHYLMLTVSKKKAVIKEVGRNSYNYLVKEGKYNFTFKIKKRLSKHVG